MYRSALHGIYSSLSQKSIISTRKILQGILSTKGRFSSIAMSTQTEASVPKPQPISAPANPQNGGEGSKKKRRGRKPKVEGTGRPENSKSQRQPKQPQVDEGPNPTAQLTAHLSLVDIDANLLHRELKKHIDEHIEDASNAGVKRMVVPGSHMKESKSTIELAKQFPKTVIAACGVHPYYVGNFVLNIFGRKENLATNRSVLEELCALDECKAVGECGLDGSDHFVPVEEQIAWFRAQLEIACKLKKPLFLHERLAFEEFKAELERCGDALPPCVVHCFTSGTDELEYYLKKGFYIGITGFVLKKPGKQVLEMIQNGALPLDRLMIETDAPFMGFKHCRKAARYNRRKDYPNIPASLPMVAKCLADAYDVSIEELADVTRKTTLSFFGVEEDST